MLEKLIALMEEVDAAGTFTDELRAEAAEMVSELPLDELEFIGFMLELLLKNLAQKRERVSLDS